MSSSPKMEIAGDLSSQTVRQQLAYVAQLFSGSLLAYPNAVLIVTGPYVYSESIAGELTKLQVAPAKIRHGPAIPITNPTPLPPSPYGTPSPMLQKPEQRASIYIEYGPPAAVRKLKVAFKPDHSSQSIEVDFEAFPDGTLKEVKAEWATPLKKVITDSERMGYRQVKIGTKIIGLVDLDRNSLQKIETALKAKLKTYLTLDLRVGSGATVRLQFYGAVGMKYSHGEIKGYGEGGGLFEIPFNLP